MAGGRSETKPNTAEAVARDLLLAEGGDPAREAWRLQVLWALICVPVPLEAAAQALGFSESADEMRVKLGQAVRQPWWSWHTVHRLFVIVAGAAA